MGYMGTWRSSHAVKSGGQCLYCCGAAAKEVGASWLSWILSCAARKMGESSISSIIYTVINDVNKRD
jgi:hypothetical protein